MQTSWIRNMLILIILGFFTNCETNLPVDSYLPVEKAPAKDFAGDVGGDVSGDYFVAPDGDDSNPGTLEEPWKTWSKAFKNAVAGDTVYFRGGTYSSTSDNGGERGFNSGTTKTPICFFNYPGETPILDCSNHDISDSAPLYNKGIMVKNVSNIYFRGLHVTNVFQKLNSNVEAFSMWMVSDITIENCVVSHADGEGFMVSEYTGTIKYLNCDAYDMCDALRTKRPPLAGTPGQNGVGFQWYNYGEYEDEDYYNSKIYYIGCRAWDFSDNGFSGSSVGYIEWNNCWAFDGGREYGDGCGWKYGTRPGTLQIQRKITNCISANNGSYGFSPNNEEWTNIGVLMYNNFAYHNGYKNMINIPAGGGWGFRWEATAFDNEQAPGELYANNLSYDNELSDFEISEAQDINDTHNSWNLELSITDADFQSLDWTQLKGARKADGSLPDITFGHLVTGSDLINAGVDVGLDYNGTAPDLGAFEKQ